LLEGSTLTWAGPAPPDVTVLRSVRSPLVWLTAYALTDPVVVPLKLAISLPAYRNLWPGSKASQDGFVVLGKTLICFRAPLDSSTLNR